VVNLHDHQTAFIMDGGSQHLQGWDEFVPVGRHHPHLAATSLVHEAVTSDDEADATPGQLAVQVG
jgi:hypothetical protein